jgi:PAS domain S-box-containing protein
LPGREEEEALSGSGIPFQTDRAPERATVYWIVLVLMAVGAVVLRNSPWRTGVVVHTATEAMATILALVIGALALVRFYSRKQSTFLFIGTGFLGTALLDGYHALVSSGAIVLGSASREQDLVAWSWTSSRIFLALFLLVSLLAWRRESRGGGRGVREVSVYLTALGLTVASFVFFAVAPLSQAYFPGTVFGRPAEFLPAIILALTLVGYVSKGAWRRDVFEHWLVVSLIVGMMTHAFFMSQSRELYDAMFDASHGLKLVSYLAVLTGLMISVFVTFRREVEAFDAVKIANDALAGEIEVRREAERVLQESERRLQHFLDTANDLIQSTRPDGAFVYANRAWQETLGYGPEQLADLNLWELVTPEGRTRVREQFERVLQGEKAGLILMELRAQDGRAVLCSGSATVHRVEGHPDAIQGIFRDVTEQRRAERELAASRANLEALVENTGDAIWSVGHDHRLITFNSAFALAVEARTGREPRRGDAPADVFSSDAVEWYEDIYARTLRGERFSRLREEEVDGHPRALEVFSNPVTDEDGVTAAVMFGRDVTRRKRAEAALLMAKEEAEAANRAKSQFLASMSHELRTPLNSVIGFANILLKNKKGNLEEKELGFLQRILSNGRHLLSLINEVLDLAKIESGRMELEIEETDLDELVSETVAQLEGRVADRDVKLVSAVPEATPPIRTDRSKLKQVIINLVGNALKFTEHGSVTVRVESADGPGSRAAAIHVEDTGIGIAEDRLEAIFEAFQQADGSTSRKYGGTGLGLAISRSICQLLGYDLDVRSAVGEGSTFSILLRDTAARPGESSPEADEVGVAGAPVGRRLVSTTAERIRDFRVLVIDDDADARIVMSHYLEEFGCAVLTATSGPEGIEMAREHRPDLITLDLLMPEMTGWEALRALKDDDGLREIPVIVISAAAEEGRSRLLGAVDALTKPVEREDLLRVMWRHLAGRRGGRVLLVDDDDEVREILADYLAEAGLEVRAARDGREALAAVDREAPDAVLLDLRMPVMDGLTCLSRLRENPYHAGLPVIVLTSGELTADERIELADKASGVIPKGEAVEERLRDVLSSLFPLSQD